MQKVFNSFRSYLNNNLIKFEKESLETLIKKFSFYYITNMNSKDYISYQKLFITKAHIIIMDICKFLNETYFIFCFDYILFIIRENDISFLNYILNFNIKSQIYVFKTNKNQLSQLIESKKFNITFIDGNFQEEIDSFSNDFDIKNIELKSFWNKINKCIEGFLIKNAYKNSFTDRVINYNKYFAKDKETIEIKKKDFVFLRHLSLNNSSFEYLIYHIQTEKLIVIKGSKNQESLKLLEREYDNYQRIHHPYISKCFGKGIIDYNQCIFIEYIDGFPLEKIHSMNFQMEVKIKIVFEIMIALKYLHDNKFIYRDLKPNNIMIDLLKTAILIDFDRMIDMSDDVLIDDHSSLIHNYLSPELSEGNPYSNKTDIYSL